MAKEKSKAWTEKLEKVEAKKTEEKKLPKEPAFKKDRAFNIFMDGIIRQNPVLVLLLGMCSTMAVSTSLLNGLGMGISTTIVLICSNFVISLLRKLIPTQIRIASYVVVVAGFVTIIDLLLQAFVPVLSNSLGIFIPLIVVNCIILARAEAFASKNTPLYSAIDGLAMGLGFTMALSVMGIFREIIGAGTLLGFPIMGSGYVPFMLIAAPCGGFMVLGTFIAVTQWLRNRERRPKKK